jgi:hypothetical protein
MVKVIGRRRQYVTLRAPEQLSQPIRLSTRCVRFAPGMTDALAL